MKNKNNNSQAVTKADFLMLLADLKKFAIKAELKKTEKSLRSEIKNGNRLLRQEMLKVEERVENLEEGQKRMEKTINKISIQLDGFVGNVGKLTEENVIATDHYRDHEKRIAKLEASTQQV